MPAALSIEQRLAHLLVEARSIVVLTGAGVSAQSGIPTFREALTGLWSQYDPDQLATPEAFARDPELVTRWYDERRLRVAACEPNPAHHALAQLQAHALQRGAAFTLITQNVDRLHQRAGSTDVIELHGSLFEWRCTMTGQQVEIVGPAFGEYPPISTSGGLLRPGVVWFGEALDPQTLASAERSARYCDLFLTIGTSALVYPAAGLLHLARTDRARTIEINKDPTPVSSLVDHALHGPAGEILPRIIEHILEA